MSMIRHGREDWRVYGRWETGEAVARVRSEFPEEPLETGDFRGETTLRVSAERLPDILALLRDEPECQFDFLTDVTAVHWPAREEPFDIVYTLYSMNRNVRLRIKARLGKEPRVPSAVPLWPAANWLERECYDMFGVIFEDHPNLKRILMPEEYDQYPLRKDQPLKS